VVNPVVPTILDTCVPLHICRGEAMLFYLICGPTTVVCVFSLQTEIQHFTRIWIYSNCLLPSPPTFSSRSGTDKSQFLQQWKKNISP